MSRRNIKIPKSQIDNFKFLLNLTEVAKLEFISIIESAPIGISETALLEHLRDNIINIPNKKIIDIFAIYVSLNNVKEELNLNDEEFLEDLIHAFKESDDIELHEIENSIDFFKNLFSSDSSINTSRKIENEYLQNEKNFGSIKVITDLRIVFDNEEITGSVIVNRLKITYVANREEKDIYLSIDENDIDILINELKSTQKKNDILRERSKHLNPINIVK